MSHPFTEQLTIEDFIAYAKKHGCEEGDEITVLDVLNGEEHVVKSLIGANGLAVALPHLDPDEKHLGPRVVDSMCKNLGIPPYHKLH
ncbi:MAG: hypothetical protein MPJ22_06305 [Pirellulales bacterium]|nr:hypothetical protein [Alphaproteobacteria bacterium]MDA8042014.1 hypothetical protein [Pirellulales bacterium]